MKVCEGRMTKPEVWALGFGLWALGFGLWALDFGPSFLRLYLLITSPFLSSGKIIEKIIKLITRGSRDRSFVWC